jgi:hypothetical protein
VPFQNLHAPTSFHLPHATGLVTARCQDATSLWVEANLADFTFMAYQNCLTRPSHGVEHTTGTVGRSADEFGARAVEGHVQDLIIVPPQSVDALTRSNIPDFAGPIN